MLTRLVTIPALLLAASSCAPKEAGSDAQSRAERTGRCTDLAPRTIAQCQKCLVPLTSEGLCADGQRHAWLEIFPNENAFDLAMRDNTICENNPHLATRVSLPSAGEVLVDPATGRAYQGSPDKGFDSPGLNVCAEVARLKTEAQYAATSPGATTTTTTTTSTTTSPATGPSQTGTTSGSGGMSAGSGGMSAGSGGTMAEAKPTQPAGSQNTSPHMGSGGTVVGGTMGSTTGGTTSGGLAPGQHVFRVGPNPGYTFIKTSYLRQAVELLENEKCRLEAGEEVVVNNPGPRTGGRGHFFARLASPKCGIPAGQTMYFFASHFTNVPQTLLDQVRAMW